MRELRERHDDLLPAIDAPCDGWRFTAAELDSVKQTLLRLINGRKQKPHVRLQAIWALAKLLDQQFGLEQRKVVANRHLGVQTLLRIAESQRRNGSAPKTD